MAATKTRTSIWASQALTAGAGNTTSDWVDIEDSYGAQVNIKLTNGSTGPTVAAQVQVEVANDTSHTIPVQYGGPFVGGVANSGEYSISIEIPPGVAAVRLVAGSNTVQDVTVDADISEITAIA